MRLTTCMDLRLRSLNRRVIAGGCTLPYNALTVVHAHASALHTFEQIYNEALSSVHVYAQAAKRDVRWPFTVRAMSTYNTVTWTARLIAYRDLPSDIPSPLSTILSRLSRSLLASRLARGGRARRGAPGWSGGLSSGLFIQSSVRAMSDY